jgi:hypothetical protein
MENKMESDIVLAMNLVILSMSLLMVALVINTL